MEIRTPWIKRNLHIWQEEKRNDCYNKVSRMDCTRRKNNQALEMKTLENTKYRKIGYCPYGFENCTLKYCVPENCKTLTDYLAQPREQSLEQSRDQSREIRGADTKTQIVRPQSCRECRFYSRYKTTRATPFFSGNFGYCEVCRMPVPISSRCKRGEKLWRQN